MTFHPSQKNVSEHYRSLLIGFGPTPAATQNSREGQMFRFNKLLEIADLNGKSVLDLGCGLGTFYPVLHAKYPQADYLGLDILPEMAQEAFRLNPGAKFSSRDVLTEGLPGAFDYVFMSQLFNDPRDDADSFLEDMITTAFAGCKRGVGLNFISSYVNQPNPELAYHDPMKFLQFCIEKVSRKTVLQHHYERCDVSLFIYR